MGRDCGKPAGVGIGAGRGHVSGKRVWRRRGRSRQEEADGGEPGVRRELRRRCGPEARFPAASAVAGTGAFCMSSTPLPNPLLSAGQVLAPPLIPRL